MIRLQGVARGFYPEPAPKVLRGVDLEVDEGEFVAVLGRSGSGKTTLLNIVGGLDSGYTGMVEVAGRELNSLSDVAVSDYRNQDVGFVFQSFHLLEHITCAENVALPATFGRGDAVIEEQEATRRARELLDRVGLGDKANEFPAKLSGGEKQRVAVARALFNRPKLIICDEPTGNLDETTSSEILELFLALNRDEEITFLVATHDQLISAAASRVVRLVDGRIAQDSARVDEEAAS
jgi:ABC-type lipoprotein export system ATPase subunit